jgi:hypothetical protein
MFYSIYVIRIDTGFNWEDRTYLKRSRLPSGEQFVLLSENLMNTFVKYNAIILTT